MTYYPISTVLSFLDCFQIFIVDCIVKASSPGLSPQPVVGPRVRVPVRVDGGDDVPVELVHELLLTRDVLGQLAHHVRDHGRADPLPRVDP